MWYGFEKKTNIMNESHNFIEEKSGETTLSLNNLFQRDISWERALVGHNVSDLHRNLFLISAEICRLCLDDNNRCIARSALPINALHWTSVTIFWRTWFRSLHDERGEGGHWCHWDKVWLWTGSNFICNKPTQHANAKTKTMYLFFARGAWSVYQHTY